MTWTLETQILFLLGTIPILTLLDAMTLLLLWKKRMPDTFGRVETSAYANQLPLPSAAIQSPSFRIRLVVTITIVLSYLTISIGSLHTIWKLLSRIPNVLTTTPKSQGVLASYNSAITIEFDTPVDFTKLDVHSNPVVPLETIGQRYIPTLPYGRKMSFRPKVTFPNDQSVMLYVSNIKSPLLTVFGSEYLMEFTTASLPKILRITPAEGSIDVPTDIDIEVQLSSPDTPQSIWELDVSPSHQIGLKRSFSDRLILDIDSPLKQGTTYTVTLYQTAARVNTTTQSIVEQGKKEVVATHSFTTIKAPFIASFKPEGNAVIPTDAIEITFDESMDKESVLSGLALSPPTSGSATWNAAATTLRYAPTVPLDKNQPYNLTLKKGISSIRSGTLEEDVSFYFTTLGPVRIKESSPTSTSPISSVNTSISITFDQEVDRSDAEKKFLTAPPISGTFSWQKNTMIFTPQTPLPFATSYTYRVEMGVSSVHGQDGQDAHEATFTTAPQEFSLPVPFYKQEEAFTCNIAAARMLLAFRGSDITELALKNAIGSLGSRGNGNPNKTHVTDYGTYWDPVAAGVTLYRPARLAKDWTLRELLAEVQQGNPVMIWGQNGWSDPHEISWTASDGTFIYAVNGMHSSVVRGFRGPVENPTHIIINDPWRGVYAIETKEFERRWSYFNVAMVVD